MKIQINLNSEMSIIAGEKKKQQAENKGLSLVQTIQGFNNVTLIYK